MEDIKENDLQKEKLIINEDMLQLVSFTIGQEEYAVEILDVQEIIRMLHITRAPNSPEYVIGVINLRGKVIPIVDLRLRMGLEQKENDKNTRIVVIEFEAKVIGFIVDKVNEVKRVNKNITEEPPNSSNDNKTEFIKEVAKLDDRLLLILDLNKIIEK